MNQSGVSPLRVAQLSDLHFSTAPGGYMLRDTAETFSAIATDLLADPPDIVVVTGDIANEGKPDEYEMAGAALADLELPVYCLPGNHDFVDALHAHLPRPGIVVQRTMRIGAWLFLFGDSNAGGVAFSDTDGWLDLPGRVHDANGSLTDHELSWLRRQLDQGGAAHAMLWIHHPPGAPGFFEQPDYDTQIGELTDTTTPLRAVAAGHAHTGITTEVAGMPSYLCPSTGVCVDFEALTLMPPGYRRYEFGADGSIATDVVWLEDERWADRWKLPGFAAEYLAGQITYEEMKVQMDGHG
jgi:Icc protein